MLCQKQNRTHSIQTLFSWLNEELDPLTEKQKQLVAILEMVRVEDFIPDSFPEAGRPQKSRTAIARSFVAKAVYNLDSTRALLERLQTAALASQ